MKKAILAIVAAGAAALLATACATPAMDASRNDDLTIRQSPEALRLAVRPEVYLLRVDLVRAYHSEMRSYFNGKTTVYQTTQVPNSYHFVAVDFGQGILYDFNGNLAVDLVAFYKLDAGNGFTLKTVPLSKWQGKPQTLTKTADSFAWPSAGPFAPGYKVHFGDSRIDIDSGPLSSKISIVSSPQGITFDPHGFLGLGKVEVKQTEADHVSFPGFWGEKKFTLEGDDTISVDKVFTAQRHVDRIDFSYKGFFGMKSEFTFVRTAQGFLFFDRKNHGVEVVRNGDTITVINNGRKVSSYQIVAQGE